MAKRKMLGEMLVEAELLSAEELGKVLTRQKASGLKLGQFLIRQNVVPEAKIIAMVSNQLKLEQYNATRFPLDMGLAQLIPGEFAREQRLVPLTKRGQLLLVAMSDPMDMGAIDAVEDLVNCEVEAVVCTEGELDNLLKKLYGAFTDIDGALKNMNQVEMVEESTDAAVREEINLASLQGMAGEAPIVRLVNSILTQAITEGASDVHLSPEKDHVHLQFRVDGKLRDIPSPPKSAFLPLVSRVKILAHMDISSNRVPQDGRFTIKFAQKEINIRVSSMPTVHGENVVLRLLDMSGSLTSLDHLGMSELETKKIRAMIVKPYGMILSTGPTGSGKTSSLYAILQELIKPEVNIITLEDPVEFRVPGIRQAQLNRQAGMTFASGLRAILRQDPDIVMVGEIRDSETAKVSVQAAMTGHLVLSTIHTNDAAGAITRLENMEVEPYMISSVMLAAFAQRLIRKVCTSCRESYLPSKQLLEAWDLADQPGTEFHRGKGCFYCNDTGFKGRTGVFETLVVDELVQSMILARKSSPEITRAVVEAGRMTTLRDDARDKVVKGITTVEEAAGAVLV